MTGRIPYRPSFPSIRSFRFETARLPLRNSLQANSAEKERFFRRSWLLPSGEPQAAYVQVEVPGLEYFPGFFIRVEEGAVREGNFRHVQGESRPLGLLGHLLPGFLLRPFEVEFSVAVLLDGDPGALYPDLYDPEFLVEEGEKFDPEDGLLRGGDVRPPVPDAHILKRDMEAGEEADPQPAADADFHSQGVGGGRLQPGLVRVHIHEENKRGRRQEEKRKEAPGREEGDFPLVGHPFSPTDARVAGRPFQPKVLPQSTRLKSMYPRSMSVCTSCTRSLSPTSAPSKPWISLPSTGG